MNFCNSYRIEEFKKHINDGAYKKYTLETLFEMVGFSNRTSFYNAFKQIEGKTPTEYTKEIES